MKWVTREKAVVERIACPWVISRFVDKAAEFLFVPPDQVLKVAKEQGAVSFDAWGADLTHYHEGDYEYVSFDAIIRKYNLHDPALLELAKIVRSADVEPPDTMPEGRGLEAAALGFRSITKDDHENLKLQFPLYDALYAYCKSKLERGGRLEHEPEPQIAR